VTREDETHHPSEVKVRGTDFSIKKNGCGAEEKAQPSAGEQENGPQSRDQWFEGKRKTGGGRTYLVRKLRRKKLGLKNSQNGAGGS